MPPYLQHVPLLGNVLRGICVRAVERMLEDLQGVLDRVEAGEPLDTLLKPKPPACAASPSSPGTLRAGLSYSLQPSLTGQQLQGAVDSLPARS